MQKYDVSRATIFRRIASFKKDDRLGRKEGRRPRKLPKDDEVRLQRMLESDPYESYGEIKEQLNLPVSTTTIRRLCTMFGLLKRVSAKKFAISDLDCERRLMVARNRKYWTLTQWRRIVFTDESGIDNSGLQRRLIWRPPGKRFDPKYFYKSPNKTLRVNFFCWASAKGLGKLTFVNNMNSEVVESMVENSIW